MAAQSDQRLSPFPATLGDSTAGGKNGAADAAAVAAGAAERLAGGGVAAAVEGAWRAAAPEPLNGATPRAAAARAAAARHRARAKSSKKGSAGPSVTARAVARVGRAEGGGLASVGVASRRAGNQRRAEAVSRELIPSFYVLFPSTLSKKTL